MAKLCSLLKALISRSQVKKLLITAIVPIYYYVYFFIMKPNLLDGDAAWFNSRPDSTIQFTIERYFTWSSRLWIEGATLYASRHIIIFGIITILSIGLLSFCISEIYKYESWVSNLILVVFLITVFPTLSLNSAGWIATTVNYLWPLSLFSFWLSIHLKRHQSKVSLMSSCLALVFLLLSVCSEILAIASLLFLLSSSIILKKRFLNFFDLFSVLTATAGVANTFLSPGNSFRKVSEAKRWFPQYDEFSILDRFIIQLNNMGNFITNSYSYLFYIMAIVLIILCLLRKQYSGLIILIIGILLFGFSGASIQTTFHGMLDKISNSGLVQTDITNLYLPGLLFILSLSLFATAVVLCSNQTSFYITVISPLVIGSAIGLAAMESPTLLASVDRPFIPLYLAMTVTAAYLTNQLFDCFNELSTNKNSTKDLLVTTQ